MKMKRVLAKDTRTALALIKESLGDDAVILSNNKIAGEVEIVAAVDYDEKRKASAKGSSFSDRLSANLDKMNAQSAQYKPTIPKVNVTSRANPSQGFDNPLNPIINYQTPVNINLARMEKELGLLRLLVERQMSQAPSRSSLFISAAAIKVSQRLERMGFEKRLIDPLLAQLKDCNDDDLLWDQAQKWLQKKLITRSEGVVHEAGIYALVGPTGVGKTTVIGKLGAQLAMKYGKEKIALISMDQKRIGARDQLRIFGAMLDIDVHHVSGFTELRNTLTQTAHKEYILIDTSGGNPFDQHIQNLVDGLIEIPQEISVYLTLAANSQSHSLRYLMKHYLGQVKGVVATKLDECLPLGGLLAALIESKQPLVMITDGQRIPLDLGYPSSEQLVAHAVEAELAEEHGSIEALSKLLHATPGKPVWQRENAPNTAALSATPNDRDLKEPYLSALELASYRSH